MSYQNTAPWSTDVVFIVEQHECVAEAHLKDLPSLLNQALEEKSLMDNKYALIGFGGPDRYLVRKAQGDTFISPFSLCFWFSSLPSCPG